MSINNLIQVNMLGGCSLTYNDKMIDSKNVHSKRIWTLLEYFITYRFKTVTQSELIDLLYPNGQSNTPLSALKTQIHRTRSALNALDFVDGKNIIIQCAGGYTWNPEIEVEADYERFESLINEAGTLDSDKDAQLRLRMEALKLYKGDFLPDAAMETWAVSITTYYHYLYMNTANFVLDELSDRNRNSEVVSVAQKAIAIDPYDERLYYFLILALANTNQIAAAKTQYEKMTKLFYSEFGTTPSKDLQALYKKLSKSDNGVEKDLGIIKGQMREAEKKRGAFFCEYEFFKDIYRLELRSTERSGKPIHICLVSVSGKDGGMLARKTQNAVMTKLAESIQSSLRSGDVFSRYSVSQYVILLPQADYDNGVMVLERIIKKYRQENEHSVAVISYTLQEITQEAPVKIG